MSGYLSDSTQEYFSNAYEGNTLSNSESAIISPFDFTDVNDSSVDKNPLVPKQEPAHVSVDSVDVVPMANFKDNHETIDNYMIQPNSVSEVLPISSEEPQLVVDNSQTQHNNTCYSKATVIIKKKNLNGLEELYKKEIASDNPKSNAVSLSAAGILAHTENIDGIKSYTKLTFLLIMLI